MKKILLCVVVAISSDVRSCSEWMKNVYNKCPKCPKRCRDMFSKSIDDLCQGRYNRAIENIKEKGGEAHNTCTDDFFDALQSIGLCAKDRVDWALDVNSALKNLGPSMNDEKKLVALLFSINYHVHWTDDRQLGNDRGWSAGKNKNKNNPSLRRLIERHDVDWCNDVIMRIRRELSPDVADLLFCKMTFDNALYDAANKNGNTDGYGKEEVQQAAYELEKVWKQKLVW